MTALLPCIGASLPAVGHLLAPMSLADRMSYTPLLICAVVDLCLAATCLALWRAAPDHPIFRSFGLYILISSTIPLWIYLGGGNSSWPLNAVAAPFLVATAGEAMRVRYRLWVRMLVPLGLAVLIAGWSPALVYVRSLPIDVSQVMLAVMIVQGFRRHGSRDSRIPLAFTAFFLVRWFTSRNFETFLHAPAYIWIDGWRWPLLSMAIAILGAATLGLFVRDLVVDRREKLRLAAELAAGRAVQQVLIPDQFPSISGFNVESAYRPFGDVGGDFFQILPLAEGGALVVIGDVSGKGMPAAMTVSLAIGALSMAVEATTRPGELLGALNRALHGRNREGFTTCLIARADPDGTLTIANAGHIGPYLEGRELALDNGLPLGLAAKSTYAETSFHLDAGQQLMLLTDGVVEARAKGGELFGFENTAAIANQTAESIAQAAQAFGQEDDITVLTLQRTVPA